MWKRKCSGCRGHRYHQNLVLSSNTIGLCSPVTVNTAWRESPEVLSTSTWLPHPWLPSQRARQEPNVSSLAQNYSLYSHYSVPSSRAFSSGNYCVSLNLPLFGSQFLSQKGKMTRKECQISSLLCHGWEWLLRLSCSLETHPRTQ